METEGKHRLMDIFVGLRDPRQAKKVDHNLAELLVVAVCAVLAGADDFVEIEEWAKEKLDWFRQYLTLGNGIPSHERIAWPWATPLVALLRPLMRNGTVLGVVTGGEKPQKQESG